MLFNKKNKSCNSNCCKGNNSPKVISSTPDKFSSVKEIAKNLLNYDAVILNTENLSKTDSIRTIDFLSGILFSINGDYRKLSSKIFLLSPSKEETEMFLKEVTPYKTNNKDTN